MKTLSNKDILYIYKNKRFRYYDFIKSDFWKAQKEDWFSRHKKICARCRARNNIQLHHKKYPKSRKFLSLKDNDFVALCGSCHYKFHKTHSTSQNMQKNSVKFIKQLGFVKYKKRLSKRQQRLIDEQELKEFPVFRMD